jgi:hypothetical protein
MKGLTSVTQMWKARTTRLAAIFLLLFAVLVGLLLYVRSANKPPAEGELISNFQTHRATYERLRDMLEADKQLLRVATWGVETTESVGIRIPPEGGFPVGRYHEYLTLLREVGGIGAFRGKGEHAESVSVLVWASGFGGDTRHVQICWVNHEPTNTVASLTDYYQTPKPRHPVFRHIDGNWYIWADW